MSFVLFEYVYNNDLISLYGNSSWSCSLVAALSAQTIILKKQSTEIEGEIKNFYDKNRLVYDQ